MKYLFVLVLMIGSMTSFGAKTVKNERKALGPKAKSEILKVLEVNEKVHTAFFKYDGSKVQSEALALHKTISEITDPTLSKLLTFSLGKLSEIKKDRNRKKNNQSYHLVSMALIHIVKTYDVGSEYNAYSCPMVKMKWVQNSKKRVKVNNPYMASMPLCGSKDSEY